MNKEIKWIQSITPSEIRQKAVKVGIGDDAAIIEQEKGMETVIAVDTMVEDIHFTKQTMTLEAIGYKALAVNISDLAAMGAIPLSYLVSIAIPKSGWTEKELSSIYVGMNRLGSRYNMDLIGGDTVSTNDKLVLTVTVIGQIEKDRRLLRTNAKVGDVFFVTGPLGSSAYGLEKLLESGYRKLINAAKLKPFIKAHQEPEPQIDGGRILAGCPFRIALNDVSDGLASEAKEIAEASNVSIEIDWDKVPKLPLIETYPIEKQEEWVLYGGEDFQLVGTVNEVNWESLTNLFEKESLSIFNIGSVTQGNREVQVRNKDGMRLITKTGYDHL
ncbi:thiamine-phosphate kinase [Evansella sp. AB-P1]|uniref:thiamine-phosphate kinase n=1 Tax=Evansella sp. AB-P1 TaxID=3037653 RepID=UPI00241DABF2|nr:thiamine-phosphate kinase [Evansella sp. AB-P1]MDG5785861.1 thiamine-phosphate kinase [Evansella sp. AB-P1]